MDSPWGCLHTYRRRRNHRHHHNGQELLKRRSAEGNYLGCRLVWVCYSLGEGFIRTICNRVHHTPRRARRTCDGDPNPGQVSSRSWVIQPPHPHRHSITGSLTTGLFVIEDRRRRDRDREDRPNVRSSGSLTERTVRAELSFFSTNDNNDDDDLFQFGVRACVCGALRFVVVVVGARARTCSHTRTD